MRLIAFAAVVFLSAAVAAKPLSRPAALKLMHDRHENMEKIGKATGQVSRTLKTDKPDLKVLRSSAAVYSRFAPKVASWFPVGTGPEAGKTHAKPAIWQNPDDFRQKSRDFVVAAKAFDRATRRGDMTAIRSSFAAVGKACKSCHDPYRAKDD
jgi:cytochrome c556